MNHLVLVFTVFVAMTSTAAWAGSTRGQRSTPPNADNTEAATTSLYGYIVQVAEARSGTGLTVVAIRPAGKEGVGWQTVPICGKQAADLKGTIGHWTQLIYSRDPLAAGRGFCRELHSADIVE